MLIFFFFKNQKAKFQYKNTEQGNTGQNFHYYPFQFIIFGNYSVYFPQASESANTI